MAKFREFPQKWSESCLLVISLIPFCHFAAMKKNCLEPQRSIFVNKVCCHYYSVIITPFEVRFFIKSRKNIAKLYRCFRNRKINFFPLKIGHFSRSSKKPGNFKSAMCLCFLLELGTVFFISVETK